MWMIVSSNKKSWLLGTVSLALTIIHAHALRIVAEPSPPPIDLAGGFVLAFILHGSLWMCTLKIIRIKLRYLMSPCVFFSGIITLSFFHFAIQQTNYFIGVSFAIVVFIFHLWLAYDLLKNKETA